jgi:glycosyltransferase involved in cell wall biosynthesis
MINEQPLVSVGIPTYNRPEGLRRTLECITKQTYKNLEIIVSDNCSPGGDTEAVVREFMVNDSRIQYFRQKENIGSFYNFQFVHEKAQGEYFAWAADDDDRTPEYLETCLQGFQKSEKLVLVNTFSELVDPQSEEVIKVDRGCTTIGLPACIRYKRYLSSIFKEQAGVGDLIYGVIKCSALNRVTPIPNILSEDHILLARLALEGEFYTIPQALMRSRPGGLSSKGYKSLAKAHLIEGSLSERRPWWVREIYLQRTIRDSTNLSPAEKWQLSAWSYYNYMFEIAPNEIMNVVRGSFLGRYKRQLQARIRERLNKLTR